MTGEEINGVVRAVLSAVGGYLVGQGIVDAATATSVVGAVATLAAVVWSIYAKRKVEPQA